MNDNKVLVELIVPSIDMTYNVFFPINRRIGNVIGLLNKSLTEITNGLYLGNEFNELYDSSTGSVYNINSLVRETNIRNGSVVILL